ncbi:hypothetical protein TNCV_877371 [Trichonephila clavipes]|nr:hypothetical protein TNCV_877371 [Trichonephila clavipes]
MLGKEVLARHLAMTQNDEVSPPRVALQCDVNEHSPTVTCCESVENELECPRHLTVVQIYEIRRPCVAF